MPTVTVYNNEGKAVGERVLSDRLFGVKPNPVVVQQVVVAEQANSRVSIAHTKTRAEVRGGGKKPWRQKGTGRARHGSIRSPIWRGGGVTFGPRSTANWTKKVNKKMKRAALLMALSDKVLAKRLIVLEDLPVTGKAKEWQTATRKVFHALEERRVHPKALLIAPTLSDALKRTTRNVPGVEAIRADSLNLVSVLGHTYAVTTVAGVDALEQWLGKARSRQSA